MFITQILQIPYYLMKYLLKYSLKLLYYLLLLQIHKSFVLGFIVPATIKINYNEGKCCNYGREKSEEIWISDEQKPCELIVLVWSDCDSFRFCNKVIPWFFVENLELVDTFLLRGLNFKDKLRRIKPDIYHFLCLSKPKVLGPKGQASQVKLEDRL